MSLSLMVQAATSGAGKSILTALLCRYFYKKGFSVAPFKAQNLSLNSFVTDKGHEISISQSFQAWVSNIEPKYDMNPILLKPKGNSSYQIILKGKPLGDFKKSDMENIRAELLKEIHDCYLNLSKKYDIVICEGSGSPVEINISKYDIANMKTAEITKSPVIIVGDIDIGGVFAGLYGTFSLLPAEHKKYVKGFIINKFRGERSILASGIIQLEKITRVPTLGVLSYHNFMFPEEDSLGMKNISSQINCNTEDIRNIWIENIDNFLYLSQKELNYKMIEDILNNGLS